MKGQEAAFSRLFTHTGERGQLAILCGCQTPGRAIYGGYIVPLIPKRSDYF